MLPKIERALLEKFTLSNKIKSKFKKWLRNLTKFIVFKDLGEINKINHKDLIFLIK